MLPQFHSARPALVLLLAALAAGCSGESPEPAATTTPAPRPAAATASSDFTAAVAMGAPAAGLKLRFRLPEAPRVGVPATLELELAASEGFRKAELQFDSEPGLRLAEAAKQGASLAGLAAGAGQALTVEFVPQAEGVYLLQATLDAEGLSGARKGTWGIPVMVTAPPTTADGATPAAAAPASPGAAVPGPAGG